MLPVTTAWLERERVPAGRQSIERWLDMRYAGQNYELLVPVPEEVWTARQVKPLREQYKTTCPCCGSDDADIIYTFWVKSAVCTNPAPPCERRSLIPLFSDYVVAQKAPSIRYWRDARCPVDRACGRSLVFSL